MRENEARNGAAAGAAGRLAKAAGLLLLAAVLGAGLVAAANHPTLTTARGTDTVATGRAM